MNGISIQVNRHDIENHVRDCTKCGKWYVMFFVDNDFSNAELLFRVANLHTGA